MSLVKSSLENQPYYNLESIFRALIITRGVTVKIQQAAVRGNYENPTNDAKGDDE